VQLCQKSEGNGTKGKIVFGHLFNTVKCCKWSRGKIMFHFQKIGAYAQTLKSEGKFVIRLKNRGTSAIAPLAKGRPFTSRGASVKKKQPMS
jgi:hypothetical protein